MTDDEVKKVLLAAAFERLKDSIEAKDVRPDHLKTALEALERARALVERDPAFDQQLERLLQETNGISEPSQN